MAIVGACVSFYVALAFLASLGQHNLFEFRLKPFLATLGFAMIGAAFCLYFHRTGLRHPVRFGLCPNCGYDLRATPERCPECGAVPEANWQSPLDERP